MNKPDENPKIEVATRAPKKKTPGIFDNLRKLPERHPVEEILGLPSTADKAVTGSTPSSVSTPSSASSPSTPSTGSTPSIGTANKPPVVRRAAAPERDYTKVANSIARVAVPAGIFGEHGGKAKELYDCLYSQTRGHVVARRKVRIPKEELMRKAGIGSEVTLRKNLARLRGVRLVKEKIFPGTHGGNEYEVFLPEEVGLGAVTPSTPSTPSTISITRQDQEGVEAAESTGSSTPLTVDISTVSGIDQTSFKDVERNDDDEAFVRLRRAMKEATGREVLAVDLAEIDELLSIEFNIAAGRTTVSSAPPFLAEHLRRRLFKKDRRQLAEEESRAPAPVPLPDSVDIGTCPDCHGSKYYYPEGYEKGVARCTHEKLRKAEG
jgi:hypothetical protein